MRIEILTEAQDDLVEGFLFYNARHAGVGSYFLDSCFSDIDALVVYAGIHPVVHGLHRLLSKRFPFAIYYSVAVDAIRVHAVLDCRRNPAWIGKRLRHRSQ